MDSSTTDICEWCKQPMLAENQVTGRPRGPVPPAGTPAPPTPGSYAPSRAPVQAGAPSAVRATMQYAGMGAGLRYLLNIVIGFAVVAALEFAFWKTGGNNFEYIFGMNWLTPSFAGAKVNMDAAVRYILVLGFMEGVLVGGVLVGTHWTPALGVLIATLLGYASSSTWQGAVIGLVAGILMSIVATKGYQRPITV
jgi:hypothetical protein